MLMMTMMWTVGMLMTTMAKSFYVADKIKRVGQQGPGYFSSWVMSTMILLNMNYQSPHKNYVINASSTLEDISQEGLVSERMSRVSLHPRSRSTSGRWIFSLIISHPHCSSCHHPHCDCHRHDYYCQKGNKCALSSLHHDSIKSLQIHQQHELTMIWWNWIEGHYIGAGHWKATNGFVGLLQMDLCHSCKWICRNVAIP